MRKPLEVPGEMVRVRAGVWEGEGHVPTARQLWSWLKVMKWREGVILEGRDVAFLAIGCDISVWLRLDVLQVKDRRLGAFGYDSYEGAAALPGGDRG